MKTIILAAGYATRLYPLTENFPKPLLEVAGRPILDWLISDIESSGKVDEYIVVSNHKFAGHFTSWAEKHPLSGKLTILDDGTSTNETRLGAVMDISFAMKERGVDDDVFIIAGDNLLDFSLVRFLDYAESKNTSCVMRFFQEDKAKLVKSGVAVIEEGSDRILSMEEKSPTPKSNWCIPPFYFYRKEDIARIDEAIADGCGIDAPGSLVAWMCQHSTINAWEMPGRRYDIGNLESYEAVKKEFGVKVRQISLPYSIDALEPVISSRTIEFHYGKHHKAYADNLAKLIVGTEYENRGLADIVKTSEGAIFNNAGQILNHNLYFEQFRPNCENKASEKEPSGELGRKIILQWGSIDSFKKEFESKGVSLFGSGWVWLSSDKEGVLEISQEAGAGNPITRGRVPLLTFDVWEHAYYLDYQNRRADHLKALWDIVDWSVVERRYFSR